jgi:signal transduction histidine kinase/ligand-binding sensor domain-containing protein
MRLRDAAAWLFSAFCGCAFALDPSLEISQYGHAAWKNREGFAPAPIWDVTQTTDGYLWLGTLAGVFRFDGVRNVPLPLPAGSALPDQRTRTLLGARDGTLWIGTWRGLASWKDGKLATYPAFDGRPVDALLEDGEGTVWVASHDQLAGMATLCALRAGRTECRGEDGSLGPLIASLYGDSRGALWAIGKDRVWRVKPEPVVVHSLPSASSMRTQAATGTPDGALLVPTEEGIVRILAGRVEPFRVASSIPGRDQRTIFRDRDGGLWIEVTSGGLLHAHQGRADAFDPADGLTGRAGSQPFEDREGNIWVGTDGGLDLFRSMAGTSYSAAQGLAGYPHSVLTARNGDVWVATAAAGSHAVYRLRDGTFTKIDAPIGATLLEDRRGRIWAGGIDAFGYIEGERFERVSTVPSGPIDAMAQDPAGILWIAHRAEGLLRLAPDGKVTRIPWSDLGPDGPAGIIAVDPKDGGLWLGLYTGGIVHVVDGHARASKALRDRLPRRRVTDIAFEPGGTLWVATEAGLARVAGEEVALLDHTSGLPCDLVHAVVFDAQSAWLSMACGLVQVARGDLRAWSSAAQGTGGWKIRARVFDRDDGIRARTLEGTTSPHMSLARDGRVWLLTQDGLTVVDPAHLPFNRVVPPVHVERVVADRVAYDARAGLRLPPLSRDIEVDYTALSFSVPGKVRFKYMLEGRDGAWIEAGTNRRALYADLPPGDYRFRVVASNDSGVWNGRGDALAFSIAPAWWQTNAFRVSLAAGIVLLLYALYRLRLAHMARQLNMKLDERMNERMRIARDLHDTLLQSFHGILLKFQTASSLMSSRPAEAKQVLDRAIDQAAEAVTEGRDAVQGLRDSVSETNDLAQAIRALGETLVAEHGNGSAPELRLDVRGESRALHPILRDEVFRIAAEALRNAFHHAHAKQVEVEIRYDEREMRLRIRDDGRGMDAKVLRQGEREGHFGLGGMRERAKLIGGKLTIWSAEGAGTEVELAIPASRAYSAVTMESGE